MNGLVEMLAADVVVYGDGGGTSPSWRRPIFGRDKVVRLLAGMSRHAHQLDITIRHTHVNGQPGAMFLDPEGRLLYVMTVDVADGVIQTVRSIINPDKLRHIGPLANLKSLRQTGA